MLRFGLFAAISMILVMSFAACDDDAVAPPADETPAPLLDGSWTLRVSPSTLHDARLLSGTFAATADTVVFTSAQGAFTGEVTGRHVDLHACWEEQAAIWDIILSLDVADDGETLTGTFSTVAKAAGGDTFGGTVFGAPGDEIPVIAVFLTPSHSSIPQGASVSLVALVTGYHDRSVSWSLEPAGVGTLGASGLYSAPTSTPDPAQVTITATSRIDIGARDTSVVQIEIPPPVCDFVHGNWEAHILVETSEGFCDDYYDLANWFIIQDECGLHLHDRGMVVELEINGRYAYGVHQIPMAQYSYHILFRNGVEIDEGSGIAYISTIEPSEPYYRPVLGFKLP